MSNENLCNCGCGFAVGSLSFIRLHVETELEQEQREVYEQYNAEQDAMRLDHEEEERRQSHNPSTCFCTKHWG